MGGRVEAASMTVMVAYDLGAEVVVLGSANAGRIVAPVSSVGDTVVSSPLYDVYIVRDAD